MSEPFVIVHRSYDPLQSDLLGDLMRDAGLNPRVTGTRAGAIIGVAQNILEVHIAVPASQAGQATDFLEAYFSSEPETPHADPAEAGAGWAEGAGEGEDEAGDAGEDDGDEGAVAQDAPVRPLLAAGSAFLTFGVGHMYARRPVTAAALFVGQLVAMMFLFGGDRWHEWTIGLVAFISIVACDVVGSTVAARAHARGLRRGRAYQSALGAAYVVGSLVLAGAVGPHLANPKEGSAPRGWRPPVHRDPLNQVDRPLEREPSFPPIVSEHPANPMARHRP